MQSPVLAQLSGLGKHRDFPVTTGGHRAGGREGVPGATEGMPKSAGCGVPEPCWAPSPWLTLPDFLTSAFSLPGSDRPHWPPRTCWCQRREGESWPPSPVEPSSHVLAKTLISSPCS